MKINHLGISGGKDSTALLLWAKFESGYDPETIRATFCDTGNECDETYAFVRMLGEKVHPIEWIKPERDFFELAEYKGRFPSARVRFCTQYLKMLPTREYCYQLLSDGHEVLLHTGVRAAESAARAELPETEFDGYYALPVFRPLLRWTLDDVWAIHKRYGIEPNPLYAFGMSRVGCTPCVMSRKDEIHRMSKLFPERFDRIRSVEGPTKLGDAATFFARDKVPKRFRSLTIITKAGQPIKVADIDDVIKWSGTGYRGEETPMFEFAEEPPTCSHTSGMCE